MYHHFIIFFTIIILIILIIIRYYYIDIRISNLKKLDTKKKLEYDPTSIDFYIKRRFSIIPNEHPPVDIYPLYYKAKKIEVTIKQGEYLFIPAGWFHYVFSEKYDNSMEDDNLNIAVSYFMKTYKKCGICDPDENKIYDNVCGTIDEKNMTLEKIIDYANNGSPVKVKNFDKYNNWDCFNWTINSIIKNYGNNNVIVNTSSSPLFASNYIQSAFDNKWNEYDTTLKKFIKTKGYHDNHYHYLLQTDINIFNKNNEIGIPNLIKSRVKQNYAIWINFSNVFTSLHYDEHDNILLQIKGKKRIILYPPSERKYLYTGNPYSNKDICSLNNQYM